MSSKLVRCPRCGFIIQSEKEGYTTMRVSKDFVDRLRNNQTDPTYEATLRRLLGWSPEASIEERGGDK